MKAMFTRFRAQRQLKKDAHLLYKQLVEQARQPAFYQSPYDVPDTIDGRFSLILLHLFIVDYTLSNIGASPNLRRAIQEVMINDMDRSLRELGVGDMSVGKEMKKVGATLLGCMKTYREAMDTTDQSVHLKAAVLRNITESLQAAAHLTNYTLSALKQLSTISLNLHSKNRSIFSAVTLPID